MSKTISIQNNYRLDSQWEEAKNFLKHNPTFSSCQVFSSNRDWTYFLVKTQQGLYRYTMSNGKLIYSQKD
jgi:hypothetical protein